MRYADFFICYMQNRSVWGPLSVDPINFYREEPLQIWPPIGPLIFEKWPPWPPWGSNLKFGRGYRWGPPRPPMDPHRGHPAIPIEARVTWWIFTSMDNWGPKWPPKWESKGVAGSPNYLASILGPYGTPKRGEVKIRYFVGDILFWNLISFVLSMFI